MNKATIRRIATFFVMAFLTVGFAANSFAQYTFIGDEVIVNGEFAGDSLSAAWSTFAADWIPVTATFDASTGEIAVTGITNTDGTTWHVQFNQVFSHDQLSSLAEGATYELSFDARTAADSTKELRVFLGQNAEPFANNAEVEFVSLDGTMKTFTQEFIVPEVFDTASGGMKLGFEMGTSNDPVYLDNISVKRKSENILKDGELIVGDSISGNWILQGDGSAATFSNDNGALRIADLNIDGLSTFEIQFRQELDDVQIDSIYPGPYEISFDAKSTVEARDVQVFVGNNGTDGDWTNFAGSAIEITDVMTNYTLPLNISQSWANMKVGFEVAYDTSGLWFDNVIFKRVREVAPEMPSFALTTTDGGVVTVEVTAVEGAASYDVYFNSQKAFTEADSATVVGTIDPENGLTFEHTTAAPHPDVAYEFTAHYAVSANSEKGSASAIESSSIETGMSTAENYAVELSTEAENALLEAFSNEEMPESSTLASFFPDSYTPFTIDGSTSLEVAGSGAVESSDHTAKFWLGFKTESQLGGDILVIYSEVVDDSVVFATEADGSGGAWNFDSYEMGIGNYTPDPWILGSQHSTHQGGADPDWQMRGGGIVNAAGDGSERGFIHGYGLPDGTRINGEVPNSQSLLDRTDDGYRVLTVITTANLATGDDAAFDFPTGEEVDLYPFQISTNDNDGASRQSQFIWGSAGENGGWWSSPDQWNIVAFVGLDAVATSNEELAIDQPMKISLDQNYPNPFNPATNIGFTLSNTANVTLEVFNLLGQKVATLINNEKLTAGSHSHSFNAANLSSGLYIYRINVGSSFTSSKKMMLIK